MFKSDLNSKQYQQLRILVEDLETEDYYKSDGYLLRWLQLTNYDPKKAAVAFRKCMEWREDNRMDSILDEDFTELATRFPLDIKATDKNGRIVVIIYVEEFNCKHLDFHRDKDHYLRFGFWTSERIERRIKEQFYKTNGTVSQAAVVIDCTKMAEHMKDIGMRKMYSVIMFLKEAVSKLAHNFPRGAEITYVVNASKLFTIFYSAVKHLSCKETVDALHIHGTESTFDWKSELFSKPENEF